MPAQVVSFLRRARPASRDWSQEELAEFYRVEAALLQSGMRIETDRGLTDEGDPWFAFCRADDGETFIHFARIDGRYIIAGPAYEGVAQGFDFPELVRDLISRHPLVNPALQRRNNSNIFMHPAALLIAVVGTAFFKTDAAKAAEASHAADDHKADKRHIAGASPATVPAPSAPAVGVAHQAGGQVVMDAVQTLSLVASAMAAMSPSSPVGTVGGPFAPLPVPAAETDLPALVVRTSGGQAALAGPAEIDAGFAAAPPPLAHVIADAPIQTAALGAFLSLTAVLQDLPSPVPAQQVSALASVLAILPADPARTYAQIEAAQLSPAPTEAKAAPPAPPPSSSAPPPPAAPATLVIDLSSGALPDVAAVRLVRELGAGVTQDSVLKLDQLPTVLAQLLARGEHLDSPNPVVAPPLTDTGLAGPVTVPTHVDALPVPTDTSGPAAPVLPVELTPVPQAPTKADIDAIIADFVARTGQTEVAINGHDIVIYDSRLMTDTAVQSSSGSVTFSFDDGSSVSLIGPSQTLHDIGALH